MTIHRGGCKGKRERDSTCKDGFVGMLASRMESTEFLPVLRIFNDHVFNVKAGEGLVFEDDLAGQILGPVPVKAAHKKELDFVDAKWYLGQAGDRRGWPEDREAAHQCPGGRHQQRRRCRAEHQAAACGDVNPAAWRRGDRCADNAP